MAKDQTKIIVDDIKHLLDKTDGGLLDIFLSIFKDAYETCILEEDYYSKVLKMYEAGKSKRQITKEFNRKGTAWLDKYHLDFGKKRQDEVAFYAKFKKSKSAILVEIKELYETKKLTIRQISTFVSSHYTPTSSSTIKNWLKESGCTIRTRKEEQDFAKYGIDINAVIKDLYLEQKLSGSEISIRIQEVYHIGITGSGVMNRIRKMGISRDLSAANLIAQNRPSAKLKQKAAQERLKADPKHLARMRDGANNGYDVKAKEFVSSIFKGLGYEDVYKQFTLDNIDGCPHSMKKKSVDVYCPSLKIAVECDGGRHKTTNDEEKEAFLKTKGVRMIRVYNIDTEEEKKEVMRIIAEVCGSINKKKHCL